MRQRILKLAALALIAIGHSAQVYAEPACGSDTSADPIEAMGKDIWLNGFCAGFGGCRLALEIFHSCQAAESFFSRFSSSRSTPPTQAQIDEAVNAAVSTPVKDVPRAAPKAMSRNVAVIERDRVADMDAKAESLVQSNCGGFGCGSILDNMVTPVIREAEKLNADPEYLAQMPKYAPIASVDAAARFGWTRENGFWVNHGAPQRQAAVAANTSTLGNYLLSVDECKKLRDRLGQEIKANPGKEPDNLSFFEGECVPQVASYAEDVKGWRALLAAQVKDKKSATASADNTLLAGHDAQSDGSQEAVVAVVPDAELAEWNEGIVVAERQHEAEMAAAAAAEQRAEEERKKAEEAAARQREVATAAVEREAARKGWVLPTDCQAEQAAVRQHQDDDRTGRDTEQSITAALQHPWEYRYSGKRMGETMPVAELREREQAYLRSIEEDERRITGCRAATGLNRIGCPTEETSNIRLYRLTACAYRVAAARRDGSTPSVSATQPSGDANCEAKLKSIDDQVGAALPRCGESAVCNLQAAMWGLSRQISTIESNCPSGKFAAKLSDARSQLESVTTTCNQIVSGGRCTPRL